MTVREFMDRFFRVRKCGGCGEILAYEHCHDAFCPDCRLKWNRAKTETCPTCFQSAVECSCQPKYLSSTGVLTLRKLVFYSSKRESEPQNRIIYHIKKNPNHRYWTFLASELKPLAEEELSILGFSAPYEDVVLVSVPRGRRSKATYGFDQSEQLCRFLSAAMRIPLANVLHRKFGGKEQKKLTQSQRQKNIRRMIDCKDGSAVRGKCVVLLDDVVTTGASMSVCASVLKKAGAKSVIALSLAQTP